MRDKIRGVNLGNWLVLEKWMCPKVFEGTTAEDEAELCAQLSREALEERLRVHREGFITEADFRWLRGVGINVVRLPIPYFLFGEAPYVECIAYVDDAFEWAQASGLSILLDLHTVPESQNGFDNGGICGVCRWHTDEAYVNRTLDLLERLAIRYKGHPALYGIELVNEPISEPLWLDTRKKYLPVDEERAKGSCAVPIQFLFDFYERGYRRLRRHLDDDKAVVISDGFRLTAWKDFMQTPEYRNVILDAHLYVSMNASDSTQQRIQDKLQRTLADHRDDLTQMGRCFPIIIGEWCLGNHIAPDGVQPTPMELQYGYRAVANAQLLEWERTAGWFFWSYKLQPSVIGWDFRECVERDWLPRDFARGI